MDVPLVPRSSRSKPTILGCAAAALGLAMAGCGEMPATVAAIHPVKGKVVLPGSASVSGLKIMFLPDGGRGKVATGPINADGSFELTTDSPGDGIAEGKYKVQLAWTPPPGAVKKGVALTPPIPAEYLDADDSGLKAEIQASTTTVGPFDLKVAKAVPPKPSRGND